jgi:opacity protein-like surface antigen
MPNRFLTLGLTAGLVLIGTAAFAQEAAPVAGRGAIEVGLRAGFGIFFGHEGKTASDATDTKLSDDLKGIIPIQVDAGYRINPKIYVGLSFQYGFGLINTDNSNNAECNSSGLSCSASDVNVGVNAHYHFLPGQAFDPWVGLGAGI